jgi:hypothetical protein
MKLFMFAAVLVISCAAFALPVTISEAELTADAKLLADGQTAGRTIVNCIPVESPTQSSPVAYAFELSPRGYIITSTDSDLPPVIAYSYTDNCRFPGEETGILLNIVRTDMEIRLESLTALPNWYIGQNRELWSEYTTGVPERTAFEQWPPVGSSPTEGWIEQNWTQSAPYNAYCPMDLIAGSRSVAGCPAVTMGMILNFQETTNSTRFNDGDDYYHNYYEYYWIDNDFVAHDFPSWPELNILLDTLDAHFANQTPLTDSDKAALVFASGSACKQVYTASGSGTFGVDQAYDAYIRFNYNGCELLYESSDSLYQRIAENMMTAMPAHLAIIDSGPQYGHNVVVDGYNTDEFFHLNFGWGGSYNGWYQFPLTGMPYSMNIIEGIVLDIGEPTQSIEESEGAVQTNPVEISNVTNPVTSAMNMVLSVQENCFVTVSLYSLSGRMVETIASGNFAPGSHSINWIPGNVPAGLYLLRVSGEAFSQTAKVTVMN